jgi:hypothetical protein
VFLAGVFQVIQVLPQGVLIKLSEELAWDSGIVAADIFDDLTFVHCVRTFLSSRVGF